jgi:hypothetical protein
MAENNKEEKTLACDNCIYKDKNEVLQKKIIESLKQLEGIKRSLLNLIK